MVWSACVIEPIVRFWMASRRRPAVQRARLRAIAGGYGAIVLILLVAGFGGAAATNPSVQWLFEGVAIVALPLLYVSFAAPRWLRRLWRQREEDEYRNAVHDLVLFSPDRPTLARRAAEWGLRLVGADGIRSVVREQLFPGVPLRYSGQTCYRGIGDLELLTSRGGASMLCVIKDCGPEGIGLLSFPKAGTSIALDLSIRDHTQALVDALNELVIAEGGRVYLAKDALTRGEHYRAMEPRLDAFLAVRRKWDPQGKLRSAQSVRILGDRP